MQTNLDSFALLNKVQTKYNYVRNIMIYLNNCLIIDVLFSIFKSIVCKLRCMNLHFLCRLLRTSSFVTVF